MSLLCHQSSPKPISNSPEPELFHWLRLQLKSLSLAGSGYTTLVKTIKLNNCTSAEYNLNRCCSDECRGPTELEASGCLQRKQKRPRKSVMGARCLKTTLVKKIITVQLKITQYRKCCLGLYNLQFLSLHASRLY